MTVLKMALLHLNLALRILPHQELHSSLILAMIVMTTTTVAKGTIVDTTKERHLLLLHLLQHQRTILMAMETVAMAITPHLLHYLPAELCYKIKWSTAGASIPTCRAAGTWQTTRRSVKPNVHKVKSVEHGHLHQILIAVGLESLCRWVFAISWPTSLVEISTMHQMAMILSLDLTDLSQFKQFK